MMPAPYSYRPAASAPSLTVMLAQGVVTVPQTDIPVTHADALSRTDREVVVHERSSKSLDTRGSNLQRQG